MQRCYHLWWKRCVIRLMTIYVGKLCRWLWLVFGIVGVLGWFAYDHLVIEVLNQLFSRWCSSFLWSFISHIDSFIGIWTSWHHVLDLFVTFPSTNNCNWNERCVNYFVVKECIDIVTHVMICVASRKMNRHRRVLFPSFSSYHLTALSFFLDRAWSSVFWIAWHRSFGFRDFPSISMPIKTLWNNSL